MDLKASTRRNDLERMLLDESSEPMPLALSLLEDITDGFSAHREIGRGGFAVVYKGIIGDRTFAVKKLSNTHMYEERFHEEVKILMKVKHKNIVRFLGYCADTQGKMEKYNGNFVMADVQQRLLCFEYLPKGSLRDYIKGASREPEWRECYQIIKSICDGLHYLHQNHIIHLDLKPTNILLDDNIVPKIVDFGISRCFEEGQSQALTSNLCGTLGYLAPELHHGNITFKADIYSLGVIITEILTGDKGFSDDYNVLETWSNRVEQSQWRIQLEQVQECTEIAIKCTDFNLANRPSTRHIIDWLGKTGSTNGSTETGVGTSSVAQMPLVVRQAEKGCNELRQGTPKVPGETRDETSHGLQGGHEARDEKMTSVYEKPKTGATETTSELKLPCHSIPDEASKHHVLESMLCDESAVPKSLEVSPVEDVTNNISDDQEIGRSGLGVVHMEKLPNGDVVVLMNPAIYEKLLGGIDRLVSVEHSNIVRQLSDGLVPLSNQSQCLDGSPKVQSMIVRKLRVTVVEGRTLPVNSKSGKCHPYVKLQFGKALHRTKTLHNAVRPNWNDKFEFDEIARGEYLKIKCYNADIFGDCSIGTARVNLEGLLDGTSRDVWVSLRKVDSGEIKLKIEAIQNDQNNNLKGAYDDSEYEDIDGAIALSLSEEDRNKGKAIDPDYSLEKDEQLAQPLQESLNTDSPRQNVPVENVLSSIPAEEPPQPFFPSSEFRTCAGCKTPIGHGRYLSCMNSVWHPQCFRCFACNKAILEYEFAVHEDQLYHKHCYKNIYHPKCDVCKIFIPINKSGLIEYRAHPFWMQKYCPSHENDGTPRCYGCERMEPTDSKYTALDDGRELCLDCLSSATMEISECQHLYMDIQEFFEGLNMKVEQQVPILLVEQHALNEALEVEKSGNHLPQTRGICLSEEQIVRTILRRPTIGPGNRIIDMVTGPYKLARRCEVTAILILYGLPRLITGSIVAHEMMHAYLRLKGYRFLSPEVEEGICQVLAHMWVESELISCSRGKSMSFLVASTSSPSTPPSSKKGAKTEFEKKLAALYKDQIETHTSVVYGDGFRAGYQAVERYGLRSTLDHMKMTGSFPN